MAHLEDIDNEAPADSLKEGADKINLIRARLDEIFDVFAAPEGSTTGDIIRWNATTEAWEVATEPLEFTEIILTPASSAPSDAEGGIFYKSSDNSIYIGTE